MFITKKSLGQNFLKCQGVLNKIVEAADIKSSDTILEIGPGLGTLTEKLLEKARKVISIEKDRRLIPILQEKFKNQIEKGKLILIEGDILKFPISLFGRAQRALANFQFPNKNESRDSKLNATSFKLVANIPYYITGQIFRKFLQDPPAGGQPQKIVLLVQKEVAQRIVARNGKENILSLSVKAYGEPKIVAKVSASAFSPRPKVDSAILVTDKISKKFFTENKINEKQFFEIIKRGFAHKRKTLINNLQPTTHNQQLKSVFKKCSLDEKVRAEDLNLNDWVCLITGAGTVPTY
jgi:16S rRNA (adenine1518-N6/adenine1519-N6)-dimethyltransferase